MPSKGRRLDGGPNGGAGNVAIATQDRLVILLRES